MKKYFLLIFLIYNYGQVAAQVPNDLCHDAIPITLGTSCQTGSTTAASTSTDPACIAETIKDVWFQYTPNISSFVTITTNVGTDDTLFNDVLSIYTGDCDNLTTVYCFNNDEYGFQGEKETVFFSASNTYFIRLDGQQKNFGLTAGDFCIALENYGNVPPSIPFGDVCNGAVELTTNTDWLSGTNENAGMGIDYPDDLERTRADVWYEFTPQIGEDVTISVQADFSHHIALYSGLCNDLTLIDKNLQGFDLNVQDLTANESYYVQISGAFSSLEGDFSIKIEDRLADVPNNDICAEALLIEASGVCMDFNNQMAAFSGVQPTCVFYPTADIWFKYIVPNQDVEGIKINTQADFLHGIAVYEGDCSHLQEVFCDVNSLACEDYLEINNLMAGATYYIQVMTDATDFDDIRGSGCLEILDSRQGENFLPLDLKVSTFCLSENTAELRIETSGGVGDYTFYGNTQGEELSVGSPYFVQVEDAAGCMQAASGVVDCSDANECDMFHYLEVQNPTCATLANGMANINVSGDEAPTFLWSNGETTPTVSNLAAGSHSITVSNGAGTCSFEVRMDITAPLPLIINARVKDNSEEGVADGSAILLPSGGTPPYTYQWMDGSSAQTLEDIPNGDYTFTVIDANSCAYSGTLSVDINNACPTSRNITLDAQPNTVECLAASEFIVASSIIAGQANMIYKAGNRIELKNGFRAVEGANFRAKIEDCSNVLALSDEDENAEIREEPETETGTFNIYPNPFNQVAFLDFYLKRREQTVSIDLYTPTGQLVKSVMNEEQLEQGAYQIQLQSADLVAGVYLVVMKSLDIQMTQPLVLIR